MNYRKSIEMNRSGKDRFMKEHPNSPITDAKIKNKFMSLEYYQIDERWRFVLPLKKYDTIETVEMELSSGGAREFSKIGYLEFKQPDTDEIGKINIYQSKDNTDHYFVPFRDKTSGVETYGAGRYMDLEKEGDKFILDFNSAYNPFCAYSENYTCPLPPYENWLEISITAGEKNFPYH